MRSRYIEKGAVLSECGLYRYSLSRTWDDDLPRVLWCMLNPSKADGYKDDPTIRKCVGFARHWNRGGIDVVNLSPWRATDPREVEPSHHWARERNDVVIREQLAHAEAVVLAWGNSWQKIRWIQDPVTLLPVSLVLRDGLVCLGFTALGNPRHPLMTPYSTELVPWSGAPIRG